jgi:LuxR family maltose regulon positive regulatory protein
MVGRGDEAIQALQDRIQRTGPSEGMMLTRLIAGVLFIQLLSGDLTRARAEAQRLEDVAKRGRLRNTLAWAWYFQACTHLQTLDLAAAAGLFARVAESRHLLEPRTATDALAGLALSHQLLGDDDGAEEAVEGLQEFVRERNDPAYDAVARSFRWRLSLLRGDPATALDRSEPARDGLTPGDLFVWLQVPALTATRALIATGSQESLGEASERLGAIRRAGESWHFTNQAIEAAVLQPLVLEKQGRAAEAQGALEEAVVLARPRGWIRPFVEAGPVMAEMLERRGRDTAEEGFVGRVLAAFEGAGAAAPAGGPRGEGPRPVPAGEQPSPEVLTNRELDILELLAQRLQDKEIADRLVIAPPTVNYHLKRLYRKLGVHGRRQAVDHARRRGILKPPSSS